MAEVTRIYSQWGQALEPLWREVLGRRLRALRTERDETLAQTAERAGISPQYLSEIERGRKEPSSEMIAALAGALDITVADLMADTAQDLRRVATAILDVTTSDPGTPLATRTFGTSLTMRTSGTPLTTRTSGTPLATRTFGTTVTTRSGQRPSGPVALARVA
jgi:transcriptional regulator with XRE-family HTH domain